MTADPASQVAAMLPMWANPDATRSQVVADICRRGWGLVPPRDAVGVLEAETGWGPHPDSGLVVVIDDRDSVRGFTARFPAPDDIATSPALTVVAAAVGLWGSPSRRRPGWAAWDLPTGWCEVAQSHGQVVVSWRAASQDDPTAAGQRWIDAIVSEAARDERWPVAVRTAQNALGAAEGSWTLLALAALFVLSIAAWTGISPADVTSGQVLDELSRLRAELDQIRPRS